MLWHSPLSTKEDLTEEQAGVQKRAVTMHMLALFAHSLWWPVTHWKPAFALLLWNSAQPSHLESLSEPWSNSAHTSVVLLYFSVLITFIGFAMLSVSSTYSSMRKLTSDSHTSSARHNAQHITMPRDSQGVDVMSIATGTTQWNTQFSTYCSYLFVVTTVVVVFLSHTEWLVGS